MQMTRDVDDARNVDNAVTRQRPVRSEQNVEVRGGNGEKWVVVNIELAYSEPWNVLHN